MAWKYKYLHTLTGTNETVVISDDGEKLEKKLPISAYLNFLDREAWEVITASPYDNKNTLLILKRLIE